MNIAYMLSVHTLVEWLKPDTLRLRAAATSETWFMSPAGAGLGSNPIRDYIC